MGNPITDFIKAYIEPLDEVEASMIDRVIGTTIKCYSMKRDESFVGGGKSILKASRPFDRYFISHSSLKASAGDTNGSMTAVDYYADLSAKRRAELMKKFGKSEE
mmetsp:Transcript_19331/g.33112  ORF Transcript_19331/g.33112 Transcript_19331/m.33112 type:complete len:105 (+) Transcript_19331:39-353(+)